MVFDEYKLDRFICVHLLRTYNNYRLYTTSRLERQVLCWVLNPCNLYSWKLICYIASSHCNFLKLQWRLWYFQEPITRSENSHTSSMTRRFHGRFIFRYILEHFCPRKWRQLSVLHAFFYDKATWRLTVQFLSPYVNRNPRTLRFFFSHSKNIFCRFVPKSILHPCPVSVNSYPDFFQFLTLH